MFLAMKTVEAIYEHGVLRPLEPLALAEGARVSVPFTEAATEKPSAPPREEGDATQRKMAEFLAAHGRQNGPVLRPRP